MKYSVIRTDTADEQIRSIVLYIAESFGRDVVLDRLADMEERVLALGDNPYMGTEPRYRVLKRQGYRVLVLEKNLVFYKIREDKKEVILYAVVDQRQDYVNIVKGL